MDLPAPPPPNSDLAWRAPRPLQADYAAIVTKQRPALINFEDGLLLVWLDGEKYLTYSIGSRGREPSLSLFEALEWTRMETVSILPNGVPHSKLELVASGPPALATFQGDVHMVYQDKKQALCHVRLSSNTFVDGRPIWIWCGSLGGSAADTPCIRVYGGFLWCVFWDLDTKELHYAHYKAVPGGDASWSTPTKITINGLPDRVMQFGSPSLIDLDGKLQLLMNWSDGVTPSRATFAPSGGADKRWQMVHQWKDVSGIESSPPGLNAVSFFGNGLAAYVDQKKVFICEYSEHGWRDPHELSSATKSPVASTSPAIAMVGNEVFCCWADENSKLVITKRQALNMPGLSSWMSAVADNTPITQLTIPGTHDSAATRTRLLWSRSAWRTSLPFAETQSLTIRQQLESGIRYFDIRCGFPTSVFGPVAGIISATSKITLDQGLFAVHGGYVELYKGTDVALSIADVFRTFYDWLDDNKDRSAHDKGKQDGILVQVKQDNGLGDAEAEKVFLDTIVEMITEAGTRWRTEATTPTMADLRGRIQLIRRFPKPKDKTVFGIDVSEKWPDNNVGIIPAQDGGPEIYVQDRWNWLWYLPTTLMNDKWDAISTSLRITRASVPSSASLCLNFVSANAPMSNCSPYDIAMGWLSWPSFFPNGKFAPAEAVNCPGMSRRLNTFLEDAAHGTGSYGVLLLDFAGHPAGLILALVQTNIDKMQAMQKSGGATTV